MDTEDLPLLEKAEKEGKYVNSGLPKIYNVYKSPCVLVVGKHNVHSPCIYLHASILMHCL